MNESLQEAIDQYLAGILNEDLNEGDLDRIKAKVELIKQLGSE